MLPASAEHGRRAPRLAALVLLLPPSARALIRLHRPGQSTVALSDHPSLIAPLTYSIVDAPLEIAASCPCDWSLADDATDALAGRVLMLPDAICAHAACSPAHVLCAAAAANASAYVAACSAFHEDAVDRDECDSGTEGKVLAACGSLVRSRRAPQPPPCRPLRPRRTR